MKRFARISRIFLAATLLALFVTAPFTPKVSAIGEEYSWEGDNRIIACKSAFEVCGVFQAAGATVPGSQEIFRPIIDFMFRGCKIKMGGVNSILVSSANNKSATITIDPGINGTNPGAGYCSANDASKVMSEQITITGTRSGSGTTETLNYAIRNATATSPLNLNIGIKAGKGQPASAPNVAAHVSVRKKPIAVLEQYQYTGTFALEPNKPYTFCAESFGCHDFDMPASTHSLVIGEYVSDRYILVEIGPNIKGNVTVTLLNESGGTVLQTKTLNTVPTGNTNAQRNTAFDNVDPGKYQVCASAGTTQKCEPVEKSYQVKATVVIDFDPIDSADLAPELQCSASIFNPLTWFICPLVAAAQGAVNLLSSAVDDMLEIKTDPIFGSGTATGRGFYSAWKNFRNLGLALILIAGLVMIISQAAGIELLDAYTIRKILPRLAIATIFITLSWPLLEFLITLSNQAGVGIRSLIYTPFRDIGQGGITIDMGDQLVAAVIGSTALLALGILALLSFVVTAFIAVFIGFFILFAREAIIMFLVILSPLAIACSILPNTQRIYDLWRTTLISMLLLFPIISGFIAICRVFAVVFYNA